MTHAPAPLGLVSALGQTVRSGVLLALVLAVTTTNAALAASTASAAVDAERTVCVSLASARPLDFTHIDDEILHGLRLRWNPAERADVSHDNDGPRVRFYGAGGLVSGERAYVLTEARFVHGAADNSIEARFLHVSTAGETILVSAALVPGEANPALEPLIARAGLGKGRVSLDVVALITSRALRAAPVVRGCEPATRWTTLDQPIEASADQIAALAALLPHG